MIAVLQPTHITNDGILFEYENKNAQSIFLVGSMNNWDATATPMEKNENGIWRISNSF